MIRKLHFLSFFSIFVCICLMLSTLSFYFLQPKVELAVNTAEKAERVIVIDAGHGGIDSGASGPDGTLEKDLNLAVSKKLAALFKIAGYTVIETRTGDYSLSGEDAKKGHVKQSDLENRLKISNEYENALFISIHMNSYRGVVCRGLQVWYSQNNEESLEMARAVQDGVKVQLQPENNRKIKSATSSIYLLRHAKNPSILIECGFISNEEECKRLSNEEYQRALCLAIFSSLHKKMSGSTCEK